MKTETRIQQECVAWFRNEFARQFKPEPIIAHIPNENQQHLVSIGLLPGYADLVIHYYPEKTLFIEMKKPGGTQSPSQQKFESRVSQLGFNYYLCDNIEHFKRVCYSQLLST